MNFSKYFFFILFTILISYSCTVKKTIPTSQDDNQIEFFIVQLNDVYEIAPLAGGTQGGMARVATIIDELEAKNKNTLAILSGDFLNPSLLGTMKYNGERIKGKQMVELMNEVGIDLVTFGNHEFDIDEADLQKRINESNFEWVVGNYDQRCGERSYPFYKEVNGEKEFLPRHHVWNIQDEDGTTLKVGFFGTTMEVRDIDYIDYTDFMSSAKKEVKALKSKSDIILGITHISIEEDMSLAKEVPSVALLMGGHEHDNMIHQVGDVRITKADANAKSAYIHTISYNKKDQTYKVNSTLKQLNQEVALEPNSTKLVDKWNVILKENITSIVDDPFSVIYTTNVPLDGRESSVRNMQTNLGQMIAEAMWWSTQGKCDAAIFNSGGIRLDDQLDDGITSVDIFRVLPFGGSIYMVEINGKLLIEVLEAGSQANGSGAYLQRNQLSKKDGQWQIANQAIDEGKNYWIAMNDYLTLGKDIPILSEQSPGVLQVIKPENDAAKALRGDIRSAIIQFLKLKK